MLDQLFILDADESVVCVLSNELPDACPVKEFRQMQEAWEGGSYTDTCRLTVPANHADAANVTQGNYILFQDSDGFWQEYKIVTVERTDDFMGSWIMAFGEHAFYELNGEPIYDIRPTDTTATAAVVQALSNTRWSIGAGDDLGTNSTRIYYTNVLAALAQIASVWGGELRFRLSVTGGTITGRTVDILTRRGSVTGKRFEYRKDMIGIVQTVDTTNLATALIGRGKGVELEGGTETYDPVYGRRLNFADVEWSTSSGDPVDKPTGQQWVGDETAAAAYGPAGRHVFGFVNFDDCTDAEELLELTYAELQNRKEPQITYDMTVLMLESISGYGHESVRLGDTVNVVNAALSPAVTGQARIIRLDRNLVDPTDCNVVLGNYIPSSADTIKRVQIQQRAISDRAGVWDRANAISADPPTAGGELQHRIDLLKTQLASTTSHFYTDSEGNFIWENDEQSKALKIGAGIFAIANTKTGGEYDWRTFGTGDGFTADEIIAGTLSAALVFAGTLYGASGTFVDLVAGIDGAQRIHTGFSPDGEPFFKMYDSDDVLKLSIVNGEIILGTDVVIKRHAIGDLVGMGVFID